MQKRKGELRCKKKKFNLTKKALILAILFLVFHLILSFLRGELSFMVPPLLTFIVDDLGANLGQGGLLQTTSTLCMGVGMIFASIVIDKSVEARPLRSPPCSCSSVAYWA